MEFMNTGRLAAALAVAAGLVAGAAEKKADPHAAVKAARAEFEAKNGAIFRGARMVAGDTLPDAERLDSPTATGVWSAVLPYSDDDRVRFLEVTLEKGKFVSGALMTFGDKDPVRIDAKRFEELRENFPMVAVRRDAALYPAKKTGTSASQERATGFGGNVFDKVLGPFGSTVPSRLGLRTGSLAYRVLFVGADGLETDLGVYRSANSRYWECAIRKPEIVQRLTEALEKAHPEKKGRISERMLIDYWKNGKLTWKGVGE